MFVVISIVVVVVGVFNVLTCSSDGQCFFASRSRASDGNEYSRIPYTTTTTTTTTITQELKFSAFNLPLRKANSSTTDIETRRQPMASTQQVLVY
jgi:hypothetical protein